MWSRRTWLVALAVATGCGGRTGAVADPEPASTDSATPVADTARSAPAPTAAASRLLPTRTYGWNALPAPDRAATSAYADAYASYLADAKVPRRAVRGLVALAINTGASELEPDARLTGAGTLAYTVGRGGDAAAFIRVGAQPIEHGVRLAIVNVDAPRIDLKQRPVFAKAGVALLDTAPYGELNLPRWLAQPLALYIYAARPGSQTGPIDLVIGDADDDPVLSIPDILPHLSRVPNRRGLVDSPERMNAVAAASRERLIEFLRSRGIDEATFEDAEASLVPAGPPAFVGVDRGLLAGYGHTHRAAAYAAVRALLEVESVELTSIVVVASRDQANWEGDSGVAFVRTAMSAAMRALAGEGVELDALGVRRIYARSAAIVTGSFGGTRNQGVALSPRADDALPGALRRVIDAFDAAAVQWHITKADTRKSQSRSLATLDMDAVDFAIPATGRGTPYELASTLDLYQGYRACRAWFEHSR